jgi:acyl transferase domain-containing protein
VLILKSLEEAQWDGDNFLAVLNGSAFNQDGSSSVLTVPNGLSQVIRDALLDVSRAWCSRHCGPQRERCIGV